eukprot:TRINITY_DN18179_c0_g1_i1.p1 TRINITY_DN18179_c0_g1~~TRINITY_DN18179_c0_g1_i1.p1  ORF type:complete len:254 (+),score=60.65 TRINITY_DN18179_c0_g1_i1:91-852(+)
MRALTAACRRVSRGAAVARPATAVMPVRPAIASHAHRLAAQVRFHKGMAKRVREQPQEGESLADFSRRLTPSKVEWGEVEAIYAAKPGWQSPAEPDESVAKQVEAAVAAYNDNEFMEKFLQICQESGVRSGKWIARTKRDADQVWAEAVSSLEKGTFAAVEYIPGASRNAAGGTLLAYVDDLTDREQVQEAVDGIRELGLDGPLQFKANIASLFNLRLPYIYKIACGQGSQVVALGESIPGFSWTDSSVLKDL